MKLFLTGLSVFTIGIGWNIFNVFFFFVMPVQTTVVVNQEQQKDTESFRQKEVLAQEEEIVDLEQTIMLDVPFTSQAPMTNWHIDAYQYGCEEASLVMAIHWLENRELTAAVAEKEISEMSHFQQEQNGNFYDTSAEDTVNLMKDYYEYENVRVQDNATADSIKKELLKGNLVIVPINADVIDNPHYTTIMGAHMLVVTGYDAETKEFITNDPGTQWGEGFRYDEHVFENGIRDYRTGHNLPITEIHKRIIVVNP